MEFWMLTKVYPNSVSIGDRIEVKEESGALKAALPAGYVDVVGPPPVPPHVPYARHGLRGSVVEINKTTIDGQTASEITFEA